MSLSVSRPLIFSDFMSLAKATETSRMAMENCLSDVDAGEAERGHLRNVFGIGGEMKHAGAFAVVEETFAVEVAGVAGDGELDVLFAGL